jgi:hypothetical protein
MPTDRIFRFSISGLMFILTSLFFHLLFGGDLIEILDLVKDRNIITFIALFFSTPIVGVIISTIALTVLFIPYGYKMLYYPPTKTYIVEEILKTNNNLRNKIVVNKALVWSRANLRDFYPHYQAKVKDCITGEKLYFLERRWSTYLTNINNISAIVVSLSITVILRCYNECNFNCLDFDFSPYKVIGVSLILIYSTTACFQLWISRRDAAHFEHILLEKEIEKDKGKDLKKQKKLEAKIKATTNSSWLSILAQLFKL